MLKKRIIAAMVLVWLFAGCTTNHPTQQTSAPLMQPASIESGSNSTEASILSAVTPGEETIEVLPRSPLQLLIENPNDGDTVYSTDVTLTGRTAPGGVVSVEDQFTVADLTGRFSLELHLDPGLQLITVEASNSAGDDIIVNLSIDVQPR